MLIYYRCLQNISKMIHQDYNILQINGSFKEVFKHRQIKTFKRNKHFKEIIGSNKIENSKVRKSIFYTSEMISMLSKHKYPLLQASSIGINIQEPIIKKD